MHGPSPAKLARLGSARVELAPPMVHAAGLTAGARGRLHSPLPPLARVRLLPFELTLSPVFRLVTSVMAGGDEVARALDLYHFADVGSDVLAAKGGAALDLYLLGALGAQHVF